MDKQLLHLPCDKAFLAIEQKVRTLQATPVTVLTRETKIKQLLQELEEYKKKSSALADVALTARIGRAQEALLEIEQKAIAPRKLRTTLWDGVSRDIEGGFNSTRLACSDGGLSEPNFTTFKNNA